MEGQECRAERRSCSGARRVPLRQHRQPIEPRRHREGNDTAGASISAPTVARYFDALEETLQRELSSFNGAKDNYPKTLITLDDMHEQSYDGIRCVYALDWLREA